MCLKIGIMVHIFSLYWKSVTVPQSTIHMKSAVNTCALNEKGELKTEAETSATLSFSHN